MEYDERGFALAADGTKLFYGVRGRGPGAVLIDGVGCDGWAWNYVQPHLAEYRRVVHWHYRGHGRSGPPVDRERNDIPSLSDDMARIMDHVQLPEAVLVGHSMGTQVALEFYRCWPVRVQALILICGSFGKITTTFHGTDLLDRLLPALIENTHKHRRLMHALWGRIPPGLAFKIGKRLGEFDGTSLKEEDFRNYVEHLTNMDLDVYLHMLQRAGEHSAADVLPTIRVPTLVIAGAQDTFTPPHLARKMADEIPGAEFFEVPGGTHSTPIEHPDLVNARIDEFLERC